MKINVKQYGWRIKGRSADSRGDKHPSNKLTTKQVKVIRELQGEFTGTFLGKFLGLDYTTIYKIWSRKLWSHI